MPIDTAEAIAELDAVLGHWEVLRQKQGNHSIEFNTMASAVIDRVAPPKSAYIEQKNKALAAPAYRALKPEDNACMQLLGVLKALRADLEAGRVRPVEPSQETSVFLPFRPYKPFEARVMSIEEAHRDLMVAARVGPQLDPIESRSGCHASAVEGSTKC